MIVQMRRAYVVGLAQHLDGVLEGLQSLGVVDATQVTPSQSEGLEGQRRALSRLEGTIKTLSQIAGGAAEGPEYDAEEVVERTEQILERRSQIDEEIRKLGRQIAQLEPWGDFDPAVIDRLAEEESIHVQLLELPPQRRQELEVPDGAEVHVARREQDRLYAVTVATRRLALGAEEIGIPETGLERLREQVSHLRQEDEELVRELKSLAGHLKGLRGSWERGVDRLRFDEAKVGLERPGELFYLTCWVPSTQEDVLSKFGAELGFVAHTEDPGRGETPPTLLHNESLPAVGEPLVNIYDTPNYKDIDPSSPVFFFFAVFFGMILGDGGYGLILLGLSLWLRFIGKTDRAKRFATLCVVLSSTCVVYGLLSNTVFARPIVSVDSPLRRWIAPLSVTTYEELGQLTKVMMISIWMGAIHIGWVSVLKARHHRVLAPYGWVMALLGVLILTRGVTKGAYVLMGVGVAWNVVLSGLEAGRGIGRRVGASFNGLRGVIQMFSDVLSYLRLFALGMATVYMGTTFNMLSGMVWKGAPLIVGIVACPLILLLGHTINLALSIMGGVIHGLRLNFIESYHWYFEGGGRPFTPFRKLRTASSGR